jgi:hypothetical protein
LLDPRSLAFFFFKAINKNMNKKLDAIELIEDTKEALILRNIENPTPLNNNEIFKSQRESELDRIFSQKKDYDLSIYQVLNSKKIQGKDLQVAKLLQHWEEKYPFKNSKDGPSGRNYYYNTFKEGICTITGFSSKVFEEQHKSDFFKVATLCRRLSLIVPRGLELLTPNRKKQIFIESRPYFPNSFSKVAKLHSCYLSELFTELTYNKTSSAKAFLKNFDLAVGNLIDTVSDQVGLSEQAESIFNKKSGEIDELSTQLIKSWVVNDKRAYINANQHLHELIRYQNHQKPDEDFIEFNKVDIKLCAKALWKIYLSSIYSNLREKVCNEGYPMIRVACELYHLMEVQSRLYIPKIEASIAEVFFNQGKLKIYIFGEKNTPDSLRKKIKHFAQENQYAKPITIEFSEKNNQTSLRIKCQPFNFSVLPEAHLKYWQLVITQSLSGKTIFHLHTENPYCSTDKILNWLLHNSLSEVMDDFKLLEKEFNRQLVPKLIENEESLQEFSDENSLFTNRPSIYFKSLYSYEYEYLSSRL